MKRLPLLLLMALAACDGPGIGAPPEFGVARVGSVSPAAALVGEWRRSALTVDNSIGVSTETTWAFGADGALQRTTRVQNLNTGVGETRTSTGRWQLTGDQLTITFTTPAAATVTFTVQTRDLELVLSGVPYRRVVG